MKLFQHPRLDHRSIEQTLSDLPRGTQGVIRQMQGGKHLTSRLAALGITIGAQLTVVQNYGHGPLLLAVRDTRVALGRGEARKIQVEAL